MKLEFLGCHLLPEKAKKAKPLLLKIQNGLDHSILVATQWSCVPLTTEVFQEIGAIQQNFL